MSYQDFITQFQLSLPNTPPIADDVTRQAAVLVPIILRPQPTVLLTVRSESLRLHPGQVAFPGGKPEDDDQSLFDTAIRESEEELGIDPKRIQRVGELPPVLSRTGFSVTPYLAALPADIEIRKNSDEVASTFELPLDYVLNQQAYRSLPVTRQQQQHHVWFLQGSNPLVWGMTAAILQQLAQQLSLNSVIGFQDPNDGLAIV